MAEAERSDNDTWIQQWIEQQRLLLQQSHGRPRGEDAAQIRTQAQQLGHQWLDLSQAWLTGLEQFAQGGESAAPASRAFQLGTDFIGAWRSQWQAATASEAATDGAATWTEVLRQLPPIGLAREHSATLRELAAAHADYQRLEQELRTMLFGVQAEALNLLERKVRERQSAQALAGFRELYDLWVDCGEQVYAQVAHSEAYCRLQAQLGNAAVQLRARQQKIIEHGLKQFDLPTRSELNSVHRQLREQARQLRELQEQLLSSQAAPPKRARSQRGKGRTP